MNKYRAKKVKTEDGTFEIQAEYARWCELKLLERAGEIAALNRQGKWGLFVNGIQVATYRDDFNYLDRSKSCVVVEDVKGFKTPVYRLKKKLMKAIHGIDILETGKSSRATVLGKVAA